jgi:hypothetical protein
MMWQDMSNPNLFQHVEQRRADMLREREQDRLAKAAINANHSGKIKVSASARLQTGAWLQNQLRRISSTLRPEMPPAHLNIDWTPQG